MPMTSTSPTEEIVGGLYQSRRIIKVLLLGCLGLYYFLITFNNLTDYYTNFQSVAHVLAMDTVPPNWHIHWRAFESNWSHHFIYIGIILWEALVAAGCLIATWRLAGCSNMDNYLRARATATLVLQFGLLFWLFVFITAGGEWFLMWQSPAWNGEEPAFRMFVITSVVLFTLYLGEGQRESIRL